VTVMDIKIGRQFVGGKAPCFIIAEIGINHSGDISLAKKLIDAAKNCGADAVKFQTFKTGNFLSKNIILPKHVKSKISFFQQLEEWELSREDHHVLSEYCKHKNIVFISTPLDEESVKILNEVRVPAFKIASGDLDNLPFLRFIARYNKPVILSTGMGTISEVGEAIETIHSEGNTDIILLHCVSIYPPQTEVVNLRAMEALKCAFQLPVGFSDHTIGIHIPLAAVAKGACVLEKHFTLDKTMEGPDHAISADPDEMKRLVKDIREIEKSLGTGIKIPSPEEIEMKKSMRRSIVAQTDIKKGEIIKLNMISMKRPGTGISPKYIDLVLGKTAKRDIRYDDLLSFDDFL